MPRGRLVFFLVVLFVAVRAAFLTADPPVEVPNGTPTHQLFVDPAAKSHEARNRALFGEWSISPADNYRFWRVQSPVWVVPLSWFYRAFGVGYAQLRTYSILGAAIGFVAFLRLAAGRLRGPPLVASALLVTLHYYGVITSRSGLPEALLSSMLTVTVLALHLAIPRRAAEGGPHLGWLLFAQWAMALSFLTKQTALLLVPLFAGAQALCVADLVRRPGPLWRKALPFVQGGLLVAALGWYVSRDDYWRTVTWNFGHMILDEDAVTRVDLGAVGAQTVFDRLTSGAKWRARFFSLMPIEGPLALGGAGWTAVRAARRRAEAWEILVAVWLVSTWAALLATPHLAAHYHVLLLPPAALLAGSVLQGWGESAAAERWVGALCRWRGKARAPEPGRAPESARAWVRVWTGLVLLPFVLLHGVWLGRWMVNRRYSIRDAGAALRAAIGDRDAVVAGMLAAPLVLETPYRHHYIKVVFNMDPEAIRSFGITHVVEMRSAPDATVKRLNELFPAAMRAARRVATLEARGHVVVLYELREPLR